MLRSFNRRTFVCATAALGLPSALGTIRLEKKNAARPADYTYEILKSAGTRQNSIVIGNRCLSNRPDAVRDATMYFDGLARMFASPDSDFEQDKNRYRRLLQKQIHDDFLEENLIHIDGWIISRTEELYCVTMAWAELKFSNYV